MLLQDFSGGINIRVAPSLLAANEAQVYTNIDNSAGSIRPIKGPTDTGTLVEKYFTYYYANEEFVGRATETSYVEYRNTLYYTQLNSNPVKYDGTNTYRLGIEPMVTVPTHTILTSGVLTGTYNYAYTYYNNTTGVESAPILYEVDLVLTSDSVKLTDFIPSTDPQVTNIRIYRLGGAITDFTLVHEKANTIDTYIDNTPDINIAGNHILDSYTYLPAPNNLKYLTTSYAMLFGAIDDKLYYSSIGLPNYWPAINFLDFDEDITGIGVVPNGILVFTKFKVYIVVGNSPETFSKYLLSGEQGCESHYTIQYTANSLIWVSQDGICATNGGDITILSAPKLGKISLVDIRNAVVLDRVYYVCHQSGILAYDFRYNQAIRTIYVLTDWLGSFNDTLYYTSSGTLYTLLTGDNLEYTYKSPILTEGSYSNLKQFKDFYIKYNGNITIKLYIDGTLVNTKALTGNSCYDLKSLSTYGGYGLEIEITGTGEVSEIEFKAMGRQNGR